MNLKEIIDNELNEMAHEPYQRSENKSDGPGKRRIKYINTDFANEIQNREKKHLGDARQERYNNNVQKLGTNKVSAYIDLAKNVLKDDNVKLDDKSKLLKLGKRLAGIGGSKPFDDTLKDIAIDVANNCVKLHSKEILDPERVQRGAERAGTKSFANFNSNNEITSKIGKNVYIEPGNGEMKIIGASLNGVDGVAIVKGKVYAIENKNNNKPPKYGEEFIKKIKDSNSGVIPIFCFNPTKETETLIKNIKQKYPENVMIGSELTDWKNKNKCQHIDASSKPIIDKTYWIQKQFPDLSKYFIFKHPLK